jgi:hypothetical protein
MSTHGMSPATKGGLSALLELLNGIPELFLDFFMLLLRPVPGTHRSFIFDYGVVERSVS